MQKLKRIFVLFLSVILVFSCTFTAFADWRDLMISSGSNASSAYGLERSSIVNVSNTVNRNYIKGWIHLVDNESGRSSYRDCTIDSSGRLLYRVPSGYTLTGYGINLMRSALPRSGVYRLQADFGSQFSIEHRSHVLQTTRLNSNAASTQSNKNIDEFVTVSSGDWYFDAIVDVGSVDSFIFICWVHDVEENEYIDGTVNINFTLSSGPAQISTVGTGMADQDFQDTLSTSFSDFSSSISDQADAIESVADAIQNLQGAMEPHYNNVLTQLHHITEQLHAFYDQVYNNIHLVQMNMLSQIKEAIENIDLEVNISLDGLKQTIQQVGQNVITNDNKLSADQIANDEANTEEVKDAVKEHGNFIIDGLKGLFIPSDEFFKAYFDDLYAYFSDRFGFLSFPIDLLVRTVNLFINSSDVDAVLTLPSFEISGEQVWADQSFNFTEFMETNFAFLLVAIRTVTSIGMIYAFVNLCQDKWDEVMKS